jgi:hypothetical protein
MPRPAQIEWMLAQIADARTAPFDSECRVGFRHEQPNSVNSRQAPSPITGHTPISFHQLIDGEGPTKNVALLSVLAVSLFGAVSSFAQTSPTDQASLRPGRLARRSVVDRPIGSSDDHDISSP